MNVIDLDLIVVVLLMGIWGRIDHSVNSISLTTSAFELIDIIL